MTEASISRTGRASRRAGRGLALVVCAVLALPLVSCASEPSAADPEPTTSAVEVTPGLVYSSPEGGDLKLDACIPTDATEPTAVVVLLHGGGFTEGDRTGGGMRAVCELFAAHGFAGFSIDYRLAPEFVYPSQVDDVEAAITWIREPEQVERFGIDPARVGLFGSSAGAILTQSVATRGTGSLQEGGRVAAAVSLSGVSLMTEEALTLGTPSDEAAAMILNYLGCPTVVAADCPQAAEASAQLSVDSSDPPMILVNGSDELVPVEQAESMAAALKAANVPVQLSVQDGSKHGIQLLGPRVRARVLEFFTERLS
ncbi:MAG: alpha/beta hydrolase [Leifsonia flava]